MNEFKQTTDPSENVKLLNEASIKALSELTDARFQRIDQVINLEVQRNDKRNEADSLKFNQQIIDLRNEFKSLINERTDLFNANRAAIEQALNGVNASLGQSLTASNLAVNKSEQLTNAKIDATNKVIDSTIRDLGDTKLAMTHLLSIDAYEVRHTELQRQVNDLRESRSQSTGSSDQSKAIYGWLIAGIGVIISIILFILRLSGR